MDALAEQLLQVLRPLHDLAHWELHLVVDGKGPRLEQQFVGQERTLSLVYSPSGTTADSIIERWLLRLDQDWSVRVASEDAAVRRAALANRADVLSAQELLHWALREQTRFSQSRDRSSVKKNKPFGNQLEGLT